MLKESDFHNFYACSLLISHTDRMSEKDLDNICLIVEEFASKILKQAKQLINVELRHSCIDSYSLDDHELFGPDPYCIDDQDRKSRLRKYRYRNKKIIKEIFKSIENFDKLRAKGNVSFDKAATLFDQLVWAELYGGEAWFKICKELDKLEKILPVFEKNLKKVILQVDHILDLEHNTDTFLNKACDSEFSVRYFLNSKLKQRDKNWDYMYELNKASPSLKRLYKSLQLVGAK